MELFMAIKRSVEAIGAAADKEIGANVSGRDGEICGARRCPPQQAERRAGPLGLLQPCLAKAQPRLRYAAEAALAGAELAHGGGEIGGAEIGPHGPGENQFRVRTLPQQKIAETALAAGADQQVDGRP